MSIGIYSPLDNCILGNDEMRFLAIRTCYYGTISLMVLWLVWQLTAAGRSANLECVCYLFGILGLGFYLEGANSYHVVTIYLDGLAASSWMVVLRSRELTKYNTVGITVQYLQRVPVWYGMVLLPYRVFLI